MSEPGKPKDFAFFGARLDPHQPGRWRWYAFTDAEVEALAGAIRERAFRSSVILHDDLAREAQAELDRRRQT